MTAEQVCREAAAKARRLVADLRYDMASNPYWACDDPGATEDEIYARGTADGMGGEAGAFAAAWTPESADAAAVLLDEAADEFAMCERINSRDPDNDGATRCMASHIAQAALKMARTLLGEADA